MTVWNFDSGKNYKAGEICLYSNEMYVAREDMIAAAWDPTKWEKIQTFKPAFDIVLPKISDKYLSTKTYNKGDFCIYNNQLYRCNDDNVTGSWNSSKWNSTTIAESFEPVPIWELHGTVTSDGTEAIIQETFTIPVKGFFIEIKLEENASDASFGVVAQFNDTNNSRRSVGDLTAAITTSVGYSNAKFEKNGNFWSGWITTPSAQYGAAALNMRNDGYIFDVDGDINLVEFRTQTTGAVIPEGSTFKIYVRR